MPVRRNSDVERQFCSKPNGCIGSGRDAVGRSVLPPQIVLLDEAIQGGVSKH